MDKTLLELIEEQRAAKVAEWSAFIDANEVSIRASAEAAEKRLAAMPQTSDEERAAFATARAAEVAAAEAAQTAFRATADQMEAGVNDLDKRRDDQLEMQRRRDEAAAASKEAPAHVNSEPLTYERYKAGGEKGTSYYRDLAAALIPGVTFQGTDQAQSLARLQRHATEMSVEMPKIAKARDERARKQVEEAEERNGSRGLAPEAIFQRGNSHEDNPFEARSLLGGREHRVTPNLTQGQGGFMTPPLWVMDVIPGLRAHDIAAGMCRQMDLPSGTDSINIPKLSTLTTAGYQQANNAGLPSQDWTDTSVQANVKTIGGYSDVALQLLEQSPNNLVDEVVTTDLMAAYYLFRDQQVVYGDGVNASALNGGHLQGLYSSAGASPWTSYNSVTYTDASPAAWKFPSVLGAMASKIGSTRYTQESLKFLLNGRRWFWYSTGVDANDRPLGETVTGGRYNIAAAIEAGLHPEGLVGTLPSVADAPVYTDYNVPTTDTAGGGTGQDVAIAALWDDVWLFSGELKTDVFREVLSGTLGVRFRVYAYNAMLVRYGQSLAIASGSGFAAPTGAVSSITF